MKPETYTPTPETRAAFGFVREYGAKQTPKHLRELPVDQVERLQRGFNRFRFGFAEPGETLTRETCAMINPGWTLVFLGNFARKCDAVACAADGGGKVNGYLCGRLARGWSVYRSIAPAYT